MRWHAHDHTEGTGHLHPGRLKTKRESTASSFSFGVGIERAGTDYRSIAAHGLLQLDCDFLDLAGERERQLVSEVHRGTSVRADVDSLAERKLDWNRLG